MERFRDADEKEMRRIKKLSHTYCDGLADMIARAPEIRRYIAKCIMGEAMAFCDCFGVDGVVEARRIREECGRATELIPPEVN